MPTCYGYGRHSTDKQGMTQHVQEAKCLAFYETQLKPRGYAWGGFFYDSALSGASPFAEREYGRQVYLLLKKGDYIVSAAMDRMFRSRRDGFHTLDTLHDMGVKYRILDMGGFDMAGMPIEWAEFFEGQMLLNAQLMRRLTGLRMREDNTVKRANGIPFSRSAPIGWKIIGDRKNRSYRVDQRERDMVSFMQTLRDDGMSYDDIANWNYTQKQFDCKRRFLTAARVKWALNARRANYPKITNIREFREKVQSGEIVFS